MFADRYISTIKRNWKKLGIATFVSSIIFLLFIVFILPGIIRTQAEKAIFAATGRKASIDLVAIHPFSLSAEVNGFRLYEPDSSKAFVELPKTEVALSLASTYHFAPVVKELHIETPRIYLVRTAANRYNFSDILEHISRQPKADKKETSRFSVNNISINNGSIDFDDRAVKGGKLHSIRELQISIPFISNIPYLAEKYTDPRLSAVVNGARFDFSGKAKPLAKSVEASLNMKLESLNLPYYLAYLPAEIPVKLDKGELTLDLAINYKIYSSKTPELKISGFTRLDNMALSERTSSQLLSFNRLNVQSRALELFSKSFEIDSISLDGMKLQISRSQDGTFNFQRLTASSQKQQISTDAKKNNAKTSQQPLIKVAELNLVNAEASFHDSVPKSGFKKVLKNINIKAKGISNTKDANTEYSISIDGDSGEKISAAGTATISPLSVSSNLDISNIKLQTAWPYLQSNITEPVKGNASITGKILFKQPDGLSLQDGKLLLSDIKSSFGDRDGVALSKVEVSGIDFNEKTNQAAVAEIALTRGTIAISKESDGKLSPLLLLQPRPVRPSTTQNSPAPTNQKPQKQLAWTVRKIRVSGLSTSFKDKTFVEPPEFRLSSIKFSASNLTGPKFLPIPVSFSAIYGNDAALKAAGTVQVEPFIRYAGNVSLSKLPIYDFEPYFPENLNINFLSGSIYSDMNLDIAIGSDGKPKGTFAGKTGIRALHAVDSAREEDLLKWESLQLDQISGNLSPLQLSIRQIALNGVYSRIAVRKDGTLNLQNLISKPKQTGSLSTTNQPKAVSSQQTATTSADNGSQKPLVKIDTLTVQGGTIDFSDSHLPSRFRTTFYNLGGRISGLNSEMNTRAEVDLRGNLENHSPLQITGRINPLRDDLFVDLTISFKDIELAPATPYSGTYLGYQIDKGKLFLDLKYHIENKQLNASNKIFIDQFTFGKDVKSDKATKLPVRLGVALLKDRKGQINLDLPVTGRTDDPKFSIWGVVWQVVVNLFTKAATSPFALMSSMFGSGEDLSSIIFAPGSYRLDASESKKLSTLSKALTERPALRVELSGYVDKTRDPEGYRNELLQQKMIHEKYLFSVKNSQAGQAIDEESISVNKDEYSKYLKAVYLKEKFPKPRNIIGMIKDLPDEEMKKLIIANTRVGEQELQNLALKRVAAVRGYLTANGKLDSQRLFQKQDNIAKQPKESSTPPSRVELNPVAQ